MAEGTHLLATVGPWEPAGERGSHLTAAHPPHRPARPPACPPARDPRLSCPSLLPRDGNFVEGLFQEVGEVASGRVREDGERPLLGLWKLSLVS